MPGFLFPTQKERRQLMEQLRELEQAQGAAFTDNELYQRFQQALADVETRIEQLSKVNDIEDERDYGKKIGIIDSLTQQQKDELLQLMITAGQAGETFLGSLQEQNKNLNTPIPGMVRKIQGLMSRDYENISAYDPAKPASLPEIIEKSRIQTVNLKGHQIEAVGNMQSSRLPMSVRTAQNQVMHGVFTKANYLSVTSEFRQMLENAKQFCSPEGQQEIDRILPGFNHALVESGITRRDGTPLREGESDDLLVGMLNRYIGSKYERSDDPLLPEQMTEFLRNIAGIDTGKLSPEAIGFLANGFAAYRGNAGKDISNRNLELKDGCRIDNRNSCMSAVAGLLGASNLIARSQGMNYIDENGNTVEGTFMDFGKGLDLDRHPELFAHVSSKPYRKKGPLMKQIADLQILDFLCMNVDRHPGNLLYQVDSNGNLIGIQGIDNDSSFGTRDVTPEDIISLRVVSESMKKKLESMSPEMLQFSLRGRGLSEEELKRTSERLTKLKEAIRKKKIKTVPDKEFAKLDFDDLKPVEGKRNIFEQFQDFIQEGVKDRIDEHIPFIPFQGYEIPPLTAVPTTGRKGTLGGLEDTLRKVAILTTTKPTGLIAKIRGQSNEFTELENAAQTGFRLFRQLSQSKKYDKAAMLTEIDVKEVLDTSYETFNQLWEKADAYLKYKRKEKGVASLEELVGKNPHEQAHIDYAKNALKLVEEYNAHLDGPANEKEREEMMSAYELRELQQRKEAYNPKPKEKSIEEQLKEHEEYQMKMGM